MKEDSLKLWKKYYKLNFYYHSESFRLLKDLIYPDSSVIEFGTRGGELLKKLQNTIKVGVNFDENFKPSGKGLKIINFKDISKLKIKFDYVILNHTLAEVTDIEEFLQNLKKLIHEDTRIIVIYFNYFWKPFSDLAELLKLKYPYPKNPNWLDTQDIENLFSLEGYEKITKLNHLLIPYQLPLLSNFLNRFIAPLPIVNNLCVTGCLVFKPRRRQSEYTVSIIIPARNEEGNMVGVLKKIPSIGKRTEVIFIEGHSKDNTYETIRKEIENYKGRLKARLYKQVGIGKGDAVRLGFEKANGEVLMILDADLTVETRELRKFYNAISQGFGDLIMGSRFVYPMGGQAMRTLNYIGNNLFSRIFSYLLGQNIKDTLCGTKVLFKKDYIKIKNQRSFFGDFDPFGDYDLIFGAKRLNLKIIEIPIRYKERTYGTTNISRFIHGWLLLKMSFIAAKKLKFR